MHSIGNIDHDNCIITVKLAKRLSLNFFQPLRVLTHKIKMSLSQKVRAMEVRGTDKI